MQITLSVDIGAVLNKILTESDESQQLKNVDFIFMVCLPMYFLGNQVLKER